MLISHFVQDVQWRNKSTHYTKLTLIHDKIWIYSIISIQFFGQKGHIPEIEKEYVEHHGNQIRFIGIEKTNYGDLVAAIITLKTRIFSVITMDENVNIVKDIKAFSKDWHISNICVYDGNFAVLLKKISIFNSYFHKIIIF